MSGETNIGAVVSIATFDDGTTPDPTDPHEVTGLPLDAAAFELLTYTPIPNIGNVGNFGVNQNMVGYESWDNLLTVQQKGSATGEQPEIRCLDVPSDGLTALETAAVITNQSNYAIKVEWPGGDIEYGAGVIGNVKRTKGANQDFREFVCTLALNQQPVIVRAP